MPVIWDLITESHIQALKGLSTGERRVLMKALERVLVNLQRSAHIRSGSVSQPYRVSSAGPTREHVRTAVTRSVAIGRILSTTD